MTDFKQEIKSYSPIDLDRLLKTNLDMPDNLKNSVLLYNKALANIRIKSEDIAIIELKKAISLNPDFCEAINLLGLLYASIKENNSARDCFERVLSIEPNDSKALEYIKLLDPNLDRAGKIKAKHREKRENKKYPDKNKKKSTQKDSNSVEVLNLVSNILKKDAVKYIIGFVAGLLVFFLISTIVNSRKPAVDIPSVVDDVYEEKNSVGYEGEYNILLGYKEELLERIEEL